MEPAIGQIFMFGGNFAPRGYAYCDGQLLSINQNQALFSILGTTYGGDGRTTFALPDLRGRTPVGQGHGPGLANRPLGQRSGTEYNNLTANQLPAHTHSADITPLTFTPFVTVSSEQGEEGSPAGNFLASDQVTMYADSPTSGAHLNGVVAGLSGTLTVASQGGSQSFNNMQPSEVVHYIIALVGVFPSRN